jgi:3-oxoadipate enol-lactonase
MPKLKLKDIEIYYEESGAGEPVLLAAPSWWPCDTWNVAVVPFLSKFFRTIIFDCRGTGYSSKPDYGYTVSQFGSDCAALLEQLSVSSCHAVGFALGGQIVQALAIERPDLVGTLTMAAVGSGRKAPDGSARNRANTDDEEIRAHGFERFIRGHIENDDMAFHAKFFRQHNDVVRALSDALWKRQTSPEQHRYHYEARRTWDTFANLDKIKAPTLVICGAEDNVNRGGSTPVGTAKKLAAHMPRAELVLVPEVKHMTFWDGSGALTALQDFLQRHPINSTAGRNL